MTQMAETPRSGRGAWAFKIAALTLLLGPLAGSLCVGTVVFAMEIVSIIRGPAPDAPVTHLVLMLAGLPWLLVLGYMFGALPALIAGALLGAYVYWTERRPWLPGLVLGTLTPPLCLTAIGANDLPPTYDVDWLKGAALLAGSAAMIGAVASLLVGLVIHRVLHRV